MRELWIKVEHSLGEDEKKRLINGTRQMLAAYIVEPSDLELARSEGAKNIVTTTSDGDILLVKNIEEVSKAKREKRHVCAIVAIRSKSDEKEIVDLAEASADYIVVKCQDWKVIPLENLIAKIHGRSKLLAFASSAREAKVSLETLEIGADGIVVEIADIEEIGRIHGAVMTVKSRASELASAEKVALTQAEIVELKPLGSGARVCIDTCDVMKDGEGLLVGCQSSGLFLVQAEVYETPFVPPRPFRVNAGSIALYVLAPGGKTRYLSELKAGDEVLIVDRSGANRVTNICRVKIEWRPLILIEAEYEGRRIKTILQNAETIRVVTVDRTESVAELKKGDIVLAHLEEGGRHFGILVEKEKVIER